MGDEKIYRLESTEKDKHWVLELSSQTSVLKCDQRQCLSLLLEVFCCLLYTVTHFPQKAGECSQHSLTVDCNQDTEDARDVQDDDSRDVQPGLHAS